MLSYNYYNIIVPSLEIALSNLILGINIVSFFRKFYSTGYWQHSVQDRLTESHYWLCESSQSLSLHDVAWHKATHLGTLSLLAESGYDDTLYVRHYILNFYLVAAS